MKKFVLQHDSGNSDKKPYKIPYREQLNSAQYEAVMHNAGPALVIAGAGTGKTRTLVYRVARLVEDGVPPESIILLTFTRRASREMLDRAATVLDDRCVKVRGGTFHNYCNQLLHRYAGYIGYPSNFTLLDHSDALDTIQHVRSSFLHQFRQKRFPNKSTIQAIISTAVNKQTTVYAVIADEYPVFLEHHEAIDEIALNYSEFKNHHGVMDFDDLLFHTRRLLAGNDEIRQKTASENRYVMIDEYQDTNTIQSELAALFSSFHNNLMVVGDDAQSIYAFRGADHKNILSFPAKFEGCKTITLEENFRSTQPILDLSNLLLGKVKDKFCKNLFTRRTDGDLPGLVQAPAERDQSRFVAQMVLQLREQGMPLSDLAILFRNGRDSYDLEWELNRKNIPFQKFGGQKFAEAAHIRDVLAHVRVIVNPEDHIAWNRVLMLLDGIGPKSASELILWLKQNKYRDPGSADIASDNYKKQLQQLGAVLTRISELKERPGKAVAEITSYYQPICEKTYDDFPKRIKDLETFSNLSGRYQTLNQLLQELTLDPLEATAMETEAAVKDESPLTLSTIHSAKGLEWDTVFIIQCLDGIIPSGYSVDSQSAMDEELRLLYVACTRAKERLFVTYPAIKEGGYGEFFSNPSRFISNIPSDILEPWQLEEEKTQKVPNSRLIEERSSSSMNSDT